MDKEICQLAVRQHGNVTRHQLLALGLGDQWIHHRVRIGFLHRVYRGVYAVGRPPTRPIEKAAAAVLACGPTGALSHMSALALWGLSGRWPTPFEVTVTTNRRPAQITVHRSSTLTRQDITRHFGIRATSPARTLYDCLPRLADPGLARAFNDALRSNHLTRTQLAELLERHPNKRLEALTVLGGGPTRSEFEDAFLEFCARHGLPRPKTNTVLAGREVDAYFERERLIVELDGWAYHSSRESFEDDRARDANALVAGIATLRITWERMIGRADQEAARLEAILAARRRR